MALCTNHQENVLMDWTKLFIYNRKWINGEFIVYDFIKIDIFKECISKPKHLNVYISSKSLIRFSKFVYLNCNKKANFKIYANVNFFKGMDRILLL